MNTKSLPKITKKDIERGSVVRKGKMWPLCHECNGYADFIDISFGPFCQSCWNIFLPSYNEYSKNYYSAMAAGMAYDDLQRRLSERKNN